MVRKALLQDMPYFYEICLKTGAVGKDASASFRDPALLGHVYAGPYLAYDAGMCFAAEEACVPRGYIVAAEDSKRFYAWMNSEWLPPLRLRYPLPYKHSASSYENDIVNTIHAPRGVPPKSIWPWYDEYPAHLHIDILPELQGKGVGRALMNALFEELKKRGVPGVHLGVSPENERALAFYKKIGFKTLSEGAGLCLGISLVS